MKLILLVLVGILAFPICGATADTVVQIEPLSIGDLESYFDRIRGFEFRRGVDNGPMYCQSGAEQPFISQPGTVVRVNYGSRLTLRNKTSEIKFLTYPAATDKGLHGFLVIEATLQPQADHQTVHVGFVTIPYFTGQMPSDRHLLILPWTDIKTASDLAKAEKDCADFDPKTGKKP